MTFCGPARDTVLTNRQTEKLNFYTNYMTIYVVCRQIITLYQKPLCNLTLRWLPTVVKKEQRKIRSFPMTQNVCYLCEMGQMGILLEVETLA